MSDGNDRTFEPQDRDAGQEATTLDEAIEKIVTPRMMVAAGRAQYEAAHPEKRFDALPATSQASIIALATVGLKAGLRAMHDGAEAQRA